MTEKWFPRELVPKVVPGSWFPIGTGTREPVPGTSPGTSGNHREPPTGNPSTTVSTALTLRRQTPAASRARQETGHRETQLTSVSRSFGERFLPNGFSPAAALGLVSLKSGCRSGGGFVTRRRSTSRRASRTCEGLSDECPMGLAEPAA